ncbi:unnamed protein product [Caenorhabditis auriculariae]|uniref:G-protein coupled receptors family 1 profile domain-containing protein n=1 Tax=Caenorhabditis auriculariae TaxID=2777116 RepID=A0A8S1GTQ3_9PELO|nr:unnamed protein product [Caenorhabditis auriculariae]
MFHQKPHFRKSLTGRPLDARPMDFFDRMPPSLKNLFNQMSAIGMEENDQQNTSVEQALGDQPSLEMMMLYTMAIIMLTLIGNSLLIYVILKNNSVLRRKRVTPVQMLMLHMCAADLLFALIAMAPTILIAATVPTFHGPNWLCKFVKFLAVLPMYASSFLLVAISADRYQAICRPLASMKSSAYNRPSMYAALAWSAALLFSTPQITFFEKIDGECVGHYTDDYQYALYVTVFNTVVWLLPSAIAGYLYFCVCRAVWRSTSFGSSIRNVHNNNKNESYCNKELIARKKEEVLLAPLSGGMQAHHNGATMQCVELDRRRVQTVKLTLTIVAANFLLWAPFCITSVIDALWPGALNPTFATYIMTFGNINSCVNPWLWFHFNRPQLRRAMPCGKTTEPFIASRRTDNQNTEMTNDANNGSDSKGSL